MWSIRLAGRRQRVVGVDADLDRAVQAGAAQPVRVGAAQSGDDQLAADRAELGDGVLRELARQADLRYWRADIDVAEEHARVSNRCATRQVRDRPSNDFL